MIKLEALCCRESLRFDPGLKNLVLFPSLLNTNEEVCVC